MTRKLRTPARALGLLAGLAILSTFSAAPAAAQDARDMARISAYLNATTTVEGAFVQIAPNGETSDGKFFISRPGRIRFEYTPPNPSLVVSDGTWVVLYDLRSCSKQAFPLSETPLEILLKDRVNLGREGAVKGVQRDLGQIRVDAIDPDNPGRGSITMIFNEQPLELRQWNVTDGEGQVTTVLLSETKQGTRIAASKFAPAEVEIEHCEGGVTQVER